MHSRGRGSRCSQRSRRRCQPCPQSFKTDCRHSRLCWLVMFCCNVECLSFTFSWLAQQLVVCSTCLYTPFVSPQLRGQLRPGSSTSRMHLHYGVRNNHSSLYQIHCEIHPTLTCMRTRHVAVLPARKTPRGVNTVVAFRIPSSGCCGFPYSVIVG